MYRLAVRPITVLAVLLFPACVSTVPDEDAGTVFLSDPIDWGAGDWVPIEGARPYLSPLYTDPLTISVCSDHFPAGEQAWENIEAVVERINQTTNVGIDITLQSIAHLDCADLFPATPTYRYVIEYSEFNGTCVDPLGATGSLVFWTPATGWNNGCVGCGALVNDYAVLPIRPSNFAAAEADPTLDAEAPATGIFAHEMGHGFGMGHLWDRTLDEQRFHSLTLPRGSGRGFFHAAGDPDRRTGGVSAYTKAALEHFYPGSGVVDSQPEWYAHELIIDRDPVDGSVDASDVYDHEDFNPRHLRYDPAEDAFLDCQTAEEPRYVLQYSDVSSLPCVVGDNLITLAWELDGVRVEDHSAIAQSCVDAYVQYHWETDVRITSTDYAIGATDIVSAVMTARVDADNDGLEPNETDNDIDLDVVLYGESASHPVDCP